MVGGIAPLEAGEGHIADAIASGAAPTHQEGRHRAAAHTAPRGLASPQGSVVRHAQRRKRR